MNRDEIIRTASAFEIAPVKYDLIETQNWSVCDTYDAVGWSVYGRMPDDTAVCINDYRTQSEAVDFVRSVRGERRVQFNTKSNGIVELKALPGKPTFDVLAGTTGDNGVFKALQEGETPDRWILAAIRQTGASSHTYTELGSYSNKDTAYFCLSAVLNLKTASFSHLLIAGAFRIADFSGGHLRPKWVVWDNENVEDFGIFQVDSSNNAQCVFHAKSLDEIVAALPENNPDNGPVMVKVNGRHKILHPQAGKITVEQLYSF